MTYDTDTAAGFAPRGYETRDESGGNDNQQDGIAEIRTAIERSFSLRRRIDASTAPNTLE